MKNSYLKIGALVGLTAVSLLAGGRNVQAAWAPYWFSTGGALTSGISAVNVPGSSRTDLFARGPSPSNLLWHQVIVGGNNSQNWDTNAGAPPGGLASAPAALYQPNAAGVDRWNVVALGTDSKLHYNYYQNGWQTSWLTLPNGILTSAAALTLNSGNRIDVWAAGQGPQKLVWHTTIDAGTSTPTLPGGWDAGAGAPTAPLGVKGAPSAFSRATGQIDIVVQSADDSMLYHRNYDGTGWSAWTQLNQFLDFNTVVAGLTSANPGSLDVFARGAGKIIYHTQFATRSPGTLVWDAAPQAPAGSPIAANMSVAAVSPQTGILDIFGVAENTNAYSRRFYAAAPSVSHTGEKTIAHLTSAADGFVPTRYSSTDVAAPQFQDSNTAPVFDSFWEMTSVSMPPNGKSPAGGCPATSRTLVAGLGHKVDRGSGFILQTDSIGTSGQTKNVTNRLFDATGLTPWVPGTDASGLDLNRYTFGSDNMTVRASTGELVHLRLGYDRQNQPSLASGGFFWRSRDCGNSWVRWPSSFPDVAVGPGFDRPELYADPWSSLVYLAADYLPPSNSGKLMKMNLTDSHPQFTDASTALTSWTPFMMTSTRTERLFLFDCDGQTPTLRYTSRGVSTSNNYGMKSIAVSADVCAAYSEPDGSQSVTQLGSGLDGDAVMVTFPIQVAGGVPTKQYLQQKVKVYTVWVSADGTRSSSTEAPGSPITASSNGGSIYQLTVVPSDRVELSPDDATDTALFYWQESSGSPPIIPKSGWSGTGFGNIVIKGMIVRDADLGGTRFQMSTGSTATAVKNGDYMRGSFYYDPSHPTQLKYTAIWNLASNAISADVVTAPWTP